MFIQHISTLVDLPIRPLLLRSRHIDGRGRRLGHLSDVDMGPLAMELRAILILQVNNEILQLRLREPSDIILLPS